MSEIQELQELIGEWADLVFPERTIQSAALKLYEEIGEMLRDPSNADEHADIYIMMFDLSRMYGIDIGKAVRDKMARNRNRTWSKSATGTLQHIDRREFVDWKYYYDLGVADFISGHTYRANSFPGDQGHYYAKGYSDASADNEGSECD